EFPQESPEAAAQLDHPNIVPIHDVGEQDGRHYFFSMSYVEGNGLNERLKEGPLLPKEAADLVRTIALAVQFADERGIVHRDLKPANVLIDANGEPRATDFGLADVESGMTRTLDVTSTPSNMPPEQVIKGEIETIGPLARLNSVLADVTGGRRAKRFVADLELSAEPFHWIPAVHVIPFADLLFP
ncbi:MAG: protein kinase, partial [Planctomycetes bacterium]|nr:protein kinase [Planctomycetota bacterium]